MDNHGQDETIFECPVCGGTEIIKLRAIPTKKKCRKCRISEHNKYMLSYNKKKKNGVNVWGK